MKRDKLYIIAKHYTIVKDVPHGPTVTVKPTAYLLSLPPQASIAEVASYIESLEADLRQYTGASTSKRRQKVSTVEFELEIAQQFLADLKQGYENRDYRAFVQQSCGAFSSHYVKNLTACESDYE